MAKEFKRQCRKSIINTSIENKKDLLVERERNNKNREVTFKEAIELGEKMEYYFMKLMIIIMKILLIF